MNVMIVGTGYVGLVSGVCLADIGHEVTCVDINPEIVQKLSNGIPTIYEEGLEELLKKNLASGRISFTTHIQDALPNAEIVVNAVGTPPDKNRRVNLAYVKQVAEEVGKHLDHYIVFVNKSTVPVGTARIVSESIKKHISKDTEFDVASNPEFLREGVAIKDFLEPDKIVVGTDSIRAREKLEELYRPLTEKGHTLLTISIQSAELLKYANNAFLVTKISFINEIARLCEAVGADVLEISRGLGLDSRIGPAFLEPGPGYGGSCFPKDIDAIINTAKDNGISLRILEAAVESNRNQRLVAISKLRGHYPSLESKNIAVWGLAFKPNTDDVRDAAALEVIQSLLAEGACVSCYDPQAMDNARKELTHENLTFSTNKWDALKNIDALVLMTQWEEFKNVTVRDFQEHGFKGLIVDCRNVWERALFEDTEIQYVGIGR